MFLLLIQTDENDINPKLTFKNLGLSHRYNINKICISSKKYLINTILLMSYLLFIINNCKSILKKY